MTLLDGFMVAGVIYFVILRAIINPPKRKKDAYYNLYPPKPHY